MADMDVDTPVPPFGGPEEITFTPAGEGILFTASNAGDEVAWSTNYDIYYVPLDLSHYPRSLTIQNRAWDTLPVFSPDGKYLAYLAMERPGFEADRFRVMLKSWPDGPEKVLTADWDRSPSSLAWGPDSRVLYATAGDLGQRSVFRIELSTGAVTRVWNQGTVSGLNVSPRHLIFGLDNLKSPVEIYRLESGSRKLSAITGVNRDRIASARMGDYEQFVFPGWNEEPVYCYVVKPVDFNPSEKYPVAFLIHGGPQGSFGNHFHYRWNPQAYTGAGFAAVMVDFHGSTGYGQAFTDSISGDWGGKPLVDLQKGLKAALTRYPWMDEDRVVALGASFGGYMINWIAGNWPDRFRCLVNHDGNLDERMAYYDTEELWFPEWEHGGTPWQNPEGYEKYNPVNYVKNWKTPMLVIHGAYDFRVVETQGFSTFTALQRMGIPSRLLYFADENHWVLKPHNSIQWHETVLDWITRWVER
jgi:dipeptidyl aminopeptidase/acylaminoacyl peptidase